MTILCNGLTPLQYKTPTKLFSVLDIKVFELLDLHVNESSVKQCSGTRHEATRISLGNISGDNESLNTGIVVDVALIIKNRIK